MGGDGSFPAAGVTATHVMNQGPCDPGPVPSQTCHLATTYRPSGAAHIH